MTRRRWLLTTLAGIALLLIVGRLIADTYADYAWYDALGATSVWRAKVETIAVARMLAWIAATVFALAHFLTVRQSIASLVVQRRVGDLEIGENVHGRYLTGSTIAFAVAVGAALALMWTDWSTTLLATSGSVFHEFDPYFGADLGFYVYWLPFESALWSWCLLVVCVTVALVVALYVLTDGLHWDKRRLRASSHARRHVTVMAGIVLLLLAWRFRLAMYETLLEGAGPGGMFNLIDHRVRVPGSLVLSLVSLGAGLCVIGAGIGGQFRLATFAVLGVGVLWISVRQILPPVVMQFTANRDTHLRDAEYLQTQAAYTKRGFAADRIASLDRATQFSSMAQAAPRVAVWDAPAIRRAVARGGVVDTTTSWVAWKATPTGLFAEMVTKPVDDEQTLPWLLTSFRASTADQTAAVQAPVPTPSAQGPGDQRTIRPPLVYPGAAGYLIVPDTMRRVAGVSLETGPVRLAYAWSLQSLRFVGRSLGAAHPTIVTHRDVRDRLERLVPFLSQGSIVTPVMAGDSLYWMVDLYAASSWYPLSSRIATNQGTVGYLRHAATAVLNASTGDVSLVPDSTLDPIAATWRNRFPGLFGSWSALPPSLRGAAAPAVDAVRAQAIAVGREGNGTDLDALCEIPDREGADSVVATRESFFELPDGTGTATTYPLVDGNDHVCGIIIGIGGAAQRTVWQRSPDPSPRWTVIAARLRAVDSSGASLGDGPVVHGAIRVIPVGAQLVYIQPAYAWRPSDSPALAYVAYTDADTTRRVASLGELERGSTGLAPASSADVLARAAALWAELAEAARRGDWSTWGRTFDALGQVLGARIHP